MRSLLLSGLLFPVTAAGLLPMPVTGYHQAQAPEAAEQDPGDREDSGAATRDRLLHVRKPAEQRRGAEAEAAKDYAPKTPGGTGPAGAPCPASPP